MKKCFIFLSFLFLFAGCGPDIYVINDIHEGEANEIIVFLASRGITAKKVQMQESAAAAATGPSNMWSITVSAEDQTKAMALLNQVGLPRRKGTSLLQLFARQGLMSSDREENIRFQAGLAEELRTTIRKIDGIIDAHVQISFPIEDSSPDIGAAATTEKSPITAAVYVKHVGVFDDPNNQLETKIKRLLAGSVQNLLFDHVSVIADRAKIADITLSPDPALIQGRGEEEGYVSIWSIVMTRGSAGRFQMILLILILLIIAFAAGFLWIFCKNYPKLLQSALAKTKKKTSQEGPSDS